VASDQVTGRARGGCGGKQREGIKYCKKQGCKRRTESARARGKIELTQRDTNTNMKAKKKKEIEEGVAGDKGVKTETAGRGDLLNKLTLLPIPPITEK